MVNQGKITWHVRCLRTSLNEKLKGKDAVLKLFSTSSVFAFPRCDCGIWPRTGRPDCSSISLYSSTESELYGDPTSLINLLLLLLLLFSGKPLVVGYDSLETRYGPLWTCEIVKRCKSSSNTQKICKWFWKLTPAWTCKPFWKVHFVAVVVVWLTEFAWKLRSNIKKFQTKICCFFVAAGLVFSVFFFCCFVGRKLAKSTFFRRFVREKFCCFPCKGKLRYMSW